MIRRYLILPFAIGAFAVLISLGAPASAAEQQPQYETRKLADNVYVFRYLGAQAMFVVTPDGVIATDPMSPAATKVYVQEIKKISPAPVRYVVYSHHHLDHISGGAPFKEAGAIFVAHRRAKEHLTNLKNPDVVIPDLVVDDGGTAPLLGEPGLSSITLDGTTATIASSCFCPKTRSSLP